MGRPEHMQAIEEVLIALRRVIRATDLHSKQLEKHTGVTAPQLLLLNTLRGAEHKTVGDVARSMHLSHATVTTIIDRLEHRALVERRRSTADKRKVYVALTPAGADMLSEAPAPLQNYFADRFGQLKEWEQTMILTSLQRIAELMDAQSLDASPVLDVGPLDRDTADKTKSEK
jgi:DNA-binding MarR family transcriptional regulator